MRTRKVRIWPLRLLALFCALLFLFSAFMAGTYAWQGEQDALNNMYSTADVMVPVELIKLEKLADGTVTQNPIANTVFYLFRESGTQIAGRYVTDKNGKINVELNAGKYYFEEVSPDIGYTYDTDRNGDAITRYYFTVTDQDKKITVKAYNRLLSGDLLIRKTVVNADGTPLSETQQKIAFEFTVTFSDCGTYSYKIDNGEKQQLTSGGTLKLSSGQTAVFEELPVGVLYNVVETPVEGYIVSSTGHRGNITENTQAVADFINRSEQASEKTVKLTVRKLLAGAILESDKELLFNMTLTVNGKATTFALKADEVKEFDIPAGAVYEINEENSIGVGFSQSIVNGFGTATEELTEVIVTNTYVGEPRVEIIGEKTWDMNGYDDVVLPESITVQLKSGDTLVEEKVVTPDENGLWQYSFIAPKYNSDGTEAQYTLVENTIPSFRASYEGYNIKNTYVKPIEVAPPIITKVVKGENAPTTVFEFVFTGQHGTPMPEGYVSYRKNLTLNGAGELEIGMITYDQAGTYVYTVHEKNGGADGWTYDTALYTITVVVTETNYALSAETTVEKLGATTDGVVFTNIFESKMDDKVIVSGIKTWEHGDNPKKDRPTSIIVEVYADGVLAVQRQVTANDNWQYSFELPRFAEDGHEIVYTIDETDVEDYEKQVDGYDLINTYIGTPDDPDVPDIPDTPDPPQTGDNTNLGFWFTLMILGLIGLIATLLMGRKQYAYVGKHYKRPKHGRY